MNKIILSLVLLGTPIGIYFGGSKMMSEVEKSTTPVVENIEEHIEDIEPTISENMKVRLRFIEAVESMIGYKYVWGGTGENNGIDCSGLIFRASKIAGCPIQRISTRTMKLWTQPENIQIGDLPMFNTSSKHNRINHVGAWKEPENDIFIHASGSRGVEERQMNPWWKRAYKITVILPSIERV